GRALVPLPGRHSVPGGIPQMGESGPCRNSLYASTDDRDESMRTAVLLVLLGAGAPALSAQTPVGPPATYPSGPTGREAMKETARREAQSGDYGGDIRICKQVLEMYADDREAQHELGAVVSWTR